MSLIKEKKRKKCRNHCSKSGYIDFTPNKGVAVKTALVGENINLSILDYFLKFKTSGIGTFSRNVTVEPDSTNVVFSG